MILDVLLDGVSMYEKGWIRENIEFPTPKPQSNTITVPGRNTPIRYTEALGRTSYQPRTFTISLSMCGTRIKFNQMINDIVNEYNGKLTQVICTDSSDVYAMGTLEISTSYNPLTGKGQVILSCTDGDSFLYHVEETRFILAGASGEFELMNDYMPVVPTVITDEGATLSWSIGDEHFQKTIGPGTWVFPELELQHGVNTIYISTNGETSLVYREGRL